MLSSSSIIYAVVLLERIMWELFLKDSSDAQSTDPLRCKLHLGRCVADVGGSG